MKSTLLLLIGLCSIVFSKAQNFTRVITDSIVNDQYESEGCAWGDFDNDGDMDLFVTNGLFNSQKNCLYRNDGSSKSFSFTKIMIGEIVNDEVGSRAASWGDYDNDGDLDMFVVTQPIPIRKSSSQNKDKKTKASDLYGVDKRTFSKNFLYQNNGDGTFTRILSGEIVNETCISDPGGWIDYNNDGFLDIFVGNDTINSLFANNGNGTFSRIAGADFEQQIAESIGHGWGDFDNDGDMDLFVGNRNDFNLFHLNNGDGTFTRINYGEVATNPKECGAGSWIDYNNDGYLDLFVTTSWFNSTNYLYLNEGPSKNFNLIRDVNAGSIVTDISSVGLSNWADFDNDGDLDCFVANFGGFDFKGQVNFLYSNNGDGTFTKISDGAIVNDKSTSTGCAWADYDNDGDMDLYVCNTLNRKNYLYRNENNNNNNWIEIKLIGKKSNVSSIGARINLKTMTNNQPMWQTRVIEGQSGLLGQNSLIAHFGLGKAAIVDTLKIQWPSGIVDIYSNIAVNKVISVYENENLKINNSNNK